MRTTVDINDDLMLALKRRAAESKRSLKELIEEAIRVSLAARRAPRIEGGAEVVITFRGRGLQHGVNLDNMGELMDIMEGPS